ncbi:GntR family transcriptional regulator [Streptococcus plurextorum]|uniref:GntR family transcriptional regulator n=1 Tax=Streptococcus plurextorum TaxID=456876 RepID=UPI00040627D6|nr:GntR family transcriptional regulator [Streptococcus plurextorum]
MSKYQRIADDLLDKILKQEYSVGQLIPPENSLAQSYQVSRQTIRQALGLLIQAGYLRAEKGVGTYVLDYSTHDTISQKGSKTIGLITTYISDYIFPKIIEGIESELRKRGYSLILSATNNDPKEELRCLQKMMAMGVAGLLIEPTASNEYNPNIAYYSRFNDLGIPIYFINAYYDLLDFPYASIDDEKAGYLATGHLIDSGHRKIGILTKLDDLQGKLRLKGYLKKHKQANLTYDASFIATFNTQNQSQVIKDYVDHVLCQDDAPTAIVCYNDLVASELLQQLKALGKHLPREISIVSHDDSFLAEAHQLTSICHPKDILGRAVAVQIVNYIERQSSLTSISYDPELKVRESVVPIRLD